jgi:hypothetical protein
MAKKRPTKGVRDQQEFCPVRDNLGVQCERESDHEGKHAYDLATGGSHQWSGGLIPLSVYAALEARTGLVVSDLLYLARTAMPDTCFATNDRVRRGQKLLEMVGWKAVR